MIQLALFVSWRIVSLCIKKKILLTHYIHDILSSNGKEAECDEVRIEQCLFPWMVTDLYPSMVSSGVPKQGESYGRKVCWW